MATTNFLSWDNPLTNCDSDSAYNAATARANGNAVNSLAPSSTHNKGFHQWGIFVAAFTQMLVAKGYSTSDADQNALAAVLANVATFADLAGLNAIQHVTYATSIVMNAKLYSGFDLTLTGNVATSAFSNLTAGQRINLVLRQDGVGGRTFSWPSNVFGVSGVISPVANSVNVQALYVTFDNSVRASAPLMIS